MKKAVAVILSLAIAVCAFSSCAQKKELPVEEVSVNTVSVPDELKADDESSSSGSGADISDESADTSESQSESSPEITGSESISESESESQSETNPESDDKTAITTSVSASGNSNVVTSSAKSTQNAAVTTTKSNSSQDSTKTTTATKAKVTTTSKAATAAVTTTSTAATTTYATMVTLKPSEISYPEGAAIISLGSSPSCSDGNVSISSNKISITAGGTYYLSGAFDGQIYIKTGEGSAGEADIDLYLGGVDISNDSGPAIFCDNAKRLEIHVVEGTSNVIADGGSDAVSNGAIFSNDTIEIRGKGRLTVYGNNREGIASDDDVFIENGEIYIFSVDDGINANDCITINGGYTYIEAGGDGIDSKGTTVMNGGTTIIGKTGEIESAIESDGTYTLNGGTLIAVGGSGIVKGATATSAQAIITLKMDSALAAKTLISIKSGSNTLINFSPAGKYSAFTFTCADIAKGSGYDIYAGGTISGASVKDGVYSGGTVSGAVKLATVSAS